MPLSLTTPAPRSSTKWRAWLVRRSKSSIYIEPKKLVGHRDVDYRPNVLRSAQLHVDPGHDPLTSTMNTM